MMATSMSKSDAGKPALTPTLSPACRCGRTISVSCPTLDDMGAACAEIERRGWIWTPEVGYSCSIACANLRKEELAAKQSAVGALVKQAPVRVNRLL